MKIAIIEDDLMIRSAVVSFLTDNHMTVVIEAQDYQAFVMQVKDLAPPDIVLLDLYTQEQNNIDKILSIKQLVPGCKVIVFTSAASEETLVECINYGADGYYLKGANPYRLMEALRATDAGGFYISPEMGVKLIQKFKDIQNDPSKIIEKNIAYYDLSHREMQVMKGLIANLAYKEMADEYNIGLNTVRYYVKSLYKKLDVNTRQELVKKMKELPPE